MDTFVVKLLSASLLWIISLCFGVALPYLLWKISSNNQRKDFENSDEGSDQDANESENLIVYGNINRCHSPTGRWNRVASWIRVKFTSGSFFSLVNCLCGGVFLGVSLLDLMPQSRAAVTAVLEQSKTVTSYPVAEFIVSLGLLLVMIIENVVTEFIPSNNSRTSSYSSERDSRTRVEEEHVIGSDLELSVSSYRMYVLVVTLSLHSIFEGLAIGLQKEISTLIQLLIAICVHKAVLSFGIGLPLFETLGRVGKLHTAMICSIIFCTASPLGCFAGAFVSTDRFNSSPGASIASALLQCLATGTFLYVTFVEVIPREFSHHAKHGSKSKHPPRKRNDLAGDSNDSALAGHSDDLAEVSISNSRRSSVSKTQTKKSQVLKLLALLIGFAIASSLQFL
ncbi:zinc transporter ZIP1-like [Styela clava]